MRWNVTTNDYKIKKEISIHGTMLSLREIVFNERV